MANEYQNYVGQILGENPSGETKRVQVDANGNMKNSIGDGLDVAKGSKSDVAITDPTLDSSEIALLKGLLKQLQGNGSGATPVSVTGSLTNDDEQLTIDATVGGITLTSAKYGTSTKALIQVETASIRYRTNGSAPTTTLGTLLNAGDILTLDSAGDIANFKAIRTGATSAVINCTYSS